MYCKSSVEYMYVFIQETTATFVSLDLGHFVSYWSHLHCVNQMSLVRKQSGKTAYKSPSALVVLKGL